jgi:hypothetical protein
MTTAVANRAAAAPGHPGRRAEWGDRFRSGACGWVAGFFFGFVLVQLDHVDKAVEFAVRGFVGTMVGAVLLVPFLFVPLPVAQRFLIAMLGMFGLFLSLQLV